MRTKVLCLFLIVLCPVCCSAGFPLAKFTAKVVDNMGAPIENADIFATFTLPSSGVGLKGKVIEGKTNKDGIFYFKSETLGSYGVTASKKGYYSSGYSFKNKVKRNPASNRWEPWNPTVVIKLKEKRNPIPMYAKRTGNIKVPVIGGTVGYDLEKGDWVSPYGKGVVSDLLFVCDARYTSNDDWECSYKLTFSNENDGIQDYDASRDRSSYKWPYEAPVEGYLPEIKWSASFLRNVDEKTDYRKGKKSIFRVRTKLDEKGNIIEAKYGKIGGNIRLYPSGNISFAYYFNPTGTRNLEYDPDQSLFKWKNRNEIYKHKISSP